MNTIWELFAGSCVFGWVISMLPYFRASIWRGYLAGFILVGVTAASGFQFGGIFVATFEPFGVMLPAVCVASSLRRYGYFVYPSISPWEKIAWACAMVIVVLGSIGIIEANIYAWFYSGWEPVVGAIVVATWAYFRGQTHILFAVFLAQCFWLLDIGSSNLYDHITHFLLIPALVISAVLQGFRGFRAHLSGKE